MKILKNKNKLKSFLPLILIVFFGLIIRLFGLNWDQGQHLHPDERFLTMVLTDIKIPENIADYINPQESTLNPYNNNYPFFVYGSLPVNLIKILGSIFNMSDYHNIYLVGRYFTIILDSLIIFLVFLITSKIANKKTSLIAAFLYSICVLPIQLSHFYTVDPFLNFFIVVSFYLLICLQNKKHLFLKTIILSLFFGFALASKISAIYFAPVIFLFFIFNFKKDFFSFFKYGFVFLILTILTFRFCQPQAFTNGNYLNWQPNSQFVQNLKDLKTWDKNPYYPPAIQWIKVIPIVFPLKNIVFWGLGIPLGIIFPISIVLTIIKINQSKNKLISFLIIFWILFLFFFQGAQSVSTMRYFLPIYPFICIISSILISNLLYSYLFKKHYILKYLLFVSLILYPAMFLSIFFKSHSRVSASLWIYKNIPIGSTIATEYWDDSLPLSMENYDSSSYEYQSVHIADVEEANLSKIDDIKNQLDKSDYYILSSNRFYKPIPENSDIFSKTTLFYKSLFNGSLGFTKIAEFSSYPCLPSIGMPQFCLNDDSAEEAFTVYDHPKVIIFKKQSIN